MKLFKIKTGDETASSAPAAENTSPPAVENVDASKQFNLPAFANRRNAIWLVISLLVLTVIFAVIQLMRSRNIYAVVGNRVITKQTFAGTRSAYDSLAQKATNVPSGLKDVTAFAREQVILDAALQNEAAKAKVSVTTADIDSQLNILGLKNGKLAQGRAGYKKELGWSDDDVDRYGRTQFLESKLNGRLLQYLDILQVAAYFYNTAGLSPDEADAQAKLTLQQRAEPLFKAKKSFLDIATASDSATGAGTPFTPTYVSANRSSVNNLTSLGEFQRAAVAKLKNTGDYTPITRGDGPYYFIDRLEGKGSGSYKGWDYYAQATTKHAKIYKGAFDLRRLTLGFNLK